MIEITGKANVNIKTTVKEAIEALYNKCIAIGKKETDKLDKRSEEIFKAIDCLRNNLAYVTNSTKNESRDIIDVDGVLSSRAYMNESYPALYADSNEVLYSLIYMFNNSTENRNINGVKVTCYDPHLSIPDEEYLNKAKEVKTALNYLKKNYSYYIKGFSAEQQAEEEDNTEYINIIRGQRERENRRYVADCKRQMAENLYRNNKNNEISWFKRKKQEEKKIIVNYWDLLGITDDSSIKHIKVAYIVQCDLAEKHEDQGSKLFERLTLLNSALATLSNPYLRYVHNCQINGEEWHQSYDEFIRNNKLESEDDFGPNINKKLLEYILERFGKYSAHDIASKGVGVVKEGLKELLASLSHNSENLSIQIQEQEAIKHIL